MKQQPVNPPIDLATFEASAATVAAQLAVLANWRRLMIACKLAERGEMSVGALAGELNLSQSAASQHLARLRNEGMVTFRREAQSLLYSLDDPRCAELLATLYRLYCKEP
jgi:ArsR family transcriptional regulator, virulence genes transcriptional regulator